MMVMIHSEYRLSMTRGTERDARLFSGYKNSLGTFPNGWIWKMEAQHQMKKDIILILLV